MLNSWKLVRNKCRSFVLHDSSYFSSFHYYYCCCMAKLCFRKRRQNRGLIFEMARICLSLQLDQIMPWTVFAFLLLFVAFLFLVVFIVYYCFLSVIIFEKIIFPHPGCDVFSLFVDKCRWNKDEYVLCLINPCRIMATCEQNICLKISTIKEMEIWNPKENIDHKMQSRWKNTSAREQCDILYK